MKKWLEKHDIFTMLLSIFAAFILWNYIMSVQNPTRTLEYRDISVQLTGVDDLYNSYNLEVISGADTTVDIRVSGSSSRLATLTASQIKVRADVSEIITAPGTYELSYLVVLPESGMTCVKRNPDTITIVVDRVETKSVPVTVKLSDNAPSGYVYENPILTTDTIRITGPKSKLEQVSAALIEIDSHDLRETSSETYFYSLVDEEGEEVDMTHISRNTASVGVTIPVRQIKKVPLEVSFSPEGSASDITAEISPKEVQIIGDSETLAEINAIQLGAINVNTAKDGDTFDFKIDVPVDVRLKAGEPKTAVVTVSINKTEKKKYTISDISLQDNNEDPNTKVTLETKTLEVELDGPLNLLNQVKAEDIHVVAELSSAELSAGRHTIGATIKTPDGVTAIGNYSVTVRIDKEETGPDTGTDTESET